MGAPPAQEVCSLLPLKQSLDYEIVKTAVLRTYSGTDVLVRGIELGCVRVPVHVIHLKSDLVTGMVPLGVRTELPVDGVSLILGNDLAGGKVFPSPVVVDMPDLSPDSDIAACFPSVFPACAVNRAQTGKWEGTVNLADLFLNSERDYLECPLAIKPQLTPNDSANSDLKVAALEFDREHLIAAQRSDQSLKPCVEAAVQLGNSKSTRIAFNWEDDVLMRCWKPHQASNKSVKTEILLLWCF